MTRRRLASAGLLATLLLAGGCTHQRSPAPSGGSGGASTPAGQPSAGPTTPPVRQVAAPWKPGMAEYGVNVYWENSPADSDEVVRAKAARILDYIVGLNANSVSFTFPFYTTGIRSTTVKAGPKTPSPARVRIAIEEATRRGLRSTVRPILNEAALVAENPKAWRGTIRPSNRATWFDNYRKLLLQYVTVGGAGAHTFVVGTELNSLEGDSRWPALIKAVKQSFGGEVAYSANFDNFQKGKVDVPADVIGVDAYPRLGLSDDAPVSRIASAWSKWLRSNDSAGPPVLDEVGLAAQNGAYLQPGHWGDASRPLNLTVQAHWYEGICRAMHNGDAAGVYWWKIDFDADPATAKKDAGDRMTFVGRPAAVVIRDCFAAPA